MQLNWRSRFGAAQQSIVGIESRDEGLAIAQVDIGPSGPKLRRCEFVTAEAAAAGAATLPDWAASQRLGRLSCNWVLCPRQYNLLLLEAPRVAPEELREALRWQIKDLVNFPVDQAVLDIFDLPEDGSRGRHMVYVVATPRQRIETVVAQVRDAGLKLKSIDIGELALRNLVERLPPEERGLALVRVQQGQGSLILIRGSQLYLSRQFEVSYQGGQDEELPEESLILEIQRSLDYYERQMAQEAPARILLCGDNVRPEKITENIRSSFVSPLEYLQVSTLLPGSENMDEAQLQLCIGALGAALRVEAD